MPASTSPASSGETRRPAGMPVIAPAPAYTCPGEEHPISRAVHLARLAAYFPKCRLCEHRWDTGQLPHSVVERIEETAARAQTGSLFARDGVQGVYLNQLSRSVARRIGAAFASVLWDAQPRIGRQQASPRPPAAQAARRTGPPVVVGYDDRNSSPDLIIGLAAGLRGMGCEVIDTGRVSRPALAFAVDHLHAAGGAYVWGSGSVPALGGVAFFGSAGRPWSRPGRLDVLEQRFESSLVRPARRGGSGRYFDVSVPYRAAFWKHLHDVKGLRVVCVCDSATIRGTLAALVEPLPCEISFDQTRPAGPLRAAASLRAAPAKPDVRLPELVVAAGAQLGVVISPDGIGCRLWDEQGTPLAPERIVEALGVHFRDEPPAASIAAGQPAEAFTEQMAARNIAIACQPPDRYWIHEGLITCDALLTLAHVLQMLSRSGQGASKLFAARGVTGS